MYKKSDRKGFAINIANLPWLTKMDSVISIVVNQGKFAIYFFYIS